MVKGFALDCSNYTGYISDYQAQSIRAHGFTRAIVGTQNHDVTLQQAEALRNAGLEIDLYVYLYPQQSASAQVDAALSITPARLLWLDAEDSNFPVGGNTVAFLQEAADACIGRIYSGIYTRKDWWETYTLNTQQFKDWPLWDCTNDHTPDMSFKLYGGWTHSVMEQYAFDQEIAGLNFDLNVYDDNPVQVEAVKVKLEEALRLLR